MDIPLASTSRIEKKPELVEALKKVLPASSILEDKAETLAYECDALTAYSCPPMLVVLPETTAQVSEVLKLCHKMNIPVIPRGSGTSLAGGAMPSADSVVLPVPDSPKKRATLPSEFTLAEQCIGSTPFSGNKKF